MAYRYEPHPHVEARKEVGPPKVAAAVAQVHGDTRFGRFNARIGLTITLLVGTMVAAYVFTIIALISLPSAIKTHNLTIIIAWVSSNFLQLVLLPVVIVGQNIQAKAADLRAKATFDDATATLHEAREIQEHLLEQDKEIARLHRRMDPSPPVPPLPASLTVPKRKKPPPK